MKSNLIGQKFGKLLVISDTGKRKHRHIVYLCKCECNNYCEVTSSSLLRGTKSCGCLQREVTSKRNKERSKHKLSNHRLYNIWAHIKQRCCNPNNAGYKNYGGRGISVCEEWENSFEAFYVWAIKNGYKENLTIDRIDNEKGYYPANCRWTSVLEQNKNKRTTPKILWNGIEYGRAEFARLIGMDSVTFRNFTKSGLNLEEIVKLAKIQKSGISLKSYNSSRRLEVMCIETREKFHSAREAARKMGLDNSSICKVCKGKKSDVKGYHFKYVNTKEESNYE